jgi:Ser-tRNA(Ala) deacylase AlaX
MSLPSLELKYNRVSEKQTSNTNTNTINNNIILGGADSSGARGGVSQETPDLSSTSVSRSDSPNNIKQFKEALISILISYFRNNVILLNNLVELSDKIITKIEDLRLLISLLIEESPVAVSIEVEEIEIKNCCGTICKNLPRYRKIKHIIINNKQTFQVSHNQYYIQMGVEFNISLEYVLL